jgi:hypothetical protein
MDNGDTIGSTRTPTAPFSVTNADEHNRMIGESPRKDSDGATACLQAHQDARRSADIKQFNSARGLERSPRSHRFGDAEFASLVEVGARIAGRIPVRGDRLGGVVLRAINRPVAEAEGAAVIPPSALVV